MAPDRARAIRSSWLPSAPLLAEGRTSGARCRVGSVKTNIGHAEAAAGVAGLIKVALALDAGVIPPSLHFETPNPEVAWDTLPIAVQTTESPWEAGVGAPIAGVSAFGIAGSNAHAVLQQWRPDGSARLTAVSAASSPRAELLPLSAHTPDALAALEEDYAQWLAADAAVPIADACHTASVRRSHFDNRTAVVGSTPAELVERLRDQGGAPGATAARGVADADPRKIVFVFPGQGSQWVGMGRELYASEPAFAAELDLIDAAFQAIEGWSLRDLLLHAGADSTRIAGIDAVQPALFAMEAALAALWRSWGVHPDAVVGHSMGEIAAAYVAGALTIEDASRIIGRRSALLRRVSGQGAMAVVELTMDEAQAAIAGHRERVAVAVSNSRRSTVLSGDPGALNLVIEQLENREVFCRLIKVDVASHSPQMDPLRDDLLTALSGVRPRAAVVPIYSTTVGQPVDGAACDGEVPGRGISASRYSSRAPSSS